MGLVKANMDKLMFFVMRNPNKLDRIGKYLSRRLSRDVSRQRYGFVLETDLLLLLYILQYDAVWYITICHALLNLIRAY